MTTEQRTRDRLDLAGNVREQHRTSGDRERMHAGYDPRRGWCWPSAGHTAHANTAQPAEVSR